MLEDDENSTELVPFQDAFPGLDVSGSERYLEDPLPATLPYPSGDFDVLLPTGPMHLQDLHLHRDMGYYGSCPAYDLIVRRHIRTRLGLTESKLGREGHIPFWGSGRFNDDTLLFEGNPSYEARSLGGGSTPPPVSVRISGDSVLGLKEVRAENERQGEELTVFTIMSIFGKMIEGLLLRPTQQFLDEVRADPGGVTLKVRRMLDDLAKEGDLFMGKWSSMVFDWTGSHVGLLLTADHAKDKTTPRETDNGLLWHNTVICHEERPVDMAIETDLGGLFDPVVVQAAMEKRVLLAIAPLTNTAHESTPGVYDDYRWDLPEDYFQRLLRGEKPVPLLGAE